MEKWWEFDEKSVRGQMGDRENDSRLLEIELGICEGEDSSKLSMN